MTRAERDALRALLHRYGIQQTYRSAGGTSVRVSTENVLATLHALGADTSGSIEQAARREAEMAAARIIEPVVLAWNGRIDNVLAEISAAKARGLSHWSLQLESGEVITQDLPANLKLPLGYHELRVQTQLGDASALVIAAPRRCYEGAKERAWGVFAPLYAIRERREQAIGDISDLTTLMRWVGELHGDIVGTLPISAAFLRTPFEPSPYAPASRLAWNEIYLHLDDGPDTGVAAEAALVDYRATAEIKRAWLEPRAAEFFATAQDKSPEFAAFLDAYPYAPDYAAFRAAGEKYDSGWYSWPEPARDGRITGADYDPSVLQYHLYVQFLAHKQLSQLAGETRRSGVRLYLDMPLGVHPDGYDTWRNRDLFVTGAAAGAPPDPFFSKGQNWGFPPTHPQRMRDQGYRYWRAVLQTQLRYAGVLRLDHVMALHRLYFIPNGLDATQGVYVRYPADELYAVLALESHRHRATIVGEDLGTVPAEIRHAMDAHGVKRMFVVQFEASDNEQRPLATVPPGAVASLNTHDMPPFRAFWEARDAELRKELGLIDEAGVAHTRAARERTIAALSRMFKAPQALDPREARNALLELLARSPAGIVLVNLEDLWLETEAQNVPGTTQEKPNWRRRLKHTLAELSNDAEVRAVLSTVESARH